MLSLFRRVLVLACALPSLCFGLDAVDPAFAPILRGPGSVRSVSWHPGTSRVYAAVSADKIQGVPFLSSLARFQADGTWDSSYAPSIAGTVNLVAVQPDGRILVAGVFSAFGGHPTTNVARLAADGSVDPTFQIQSLPNDVISVASDAAGRVLVGMRGYPTTQFVNGQPVEVPPVLLLRLQAHGTVDAGFAPTFGSASQGGFLFNPLRVNSLNPLPDGKLLVGGNFGRANGQTQPVLARLNADGSLDSSYQPVFATPEGGFPSTISDVLEVWSLQTLGDGSTLVAGAFATVNGYTQRSAARLQANGSLDLSFRVIFTNNLFGSGPIVYTAAVDAQERTILVGSFGSIDGLSYGFAAARVDRYGRPDALFRPLFSNQDKVAILPGDYTVFGRAGALSANYEVQPGLSGFLPGGAADPAFQKELRALSRPDFLVARPGQGPLVGGLFLLEFNGENRRGLTALTPTGQVDPAFLATFAPAAAATCSLVLPSGRILVGGGFTSCNGLPRPRLALLEANGTLVQDFDLGSGPDAAVDLLRLLPTGKVLVGGNFSSLNGFVAKSLAVLDLSQLPGNAPISVSQILQARYGTETAFLDVTTRLQNALQNGALTFAVSAFSLGGDPAPLQSKFLTVTYRTNLGDRTARLQDNTTLNLPNRPWDSGLVDPTFRPLNTETLFARDVAGQADGSIIVLGSFGSFAGAPRASLVRLRANGSLDGFVPQAQFSGFSPASVAVEESGKVYLGGYLLLPGGSGSIGLVRLQSDGTRDPSFVGPASITGADRILLQADGRIFCAGSFGSSSPGSRRYVARLLQDGSIDPSFDAGTSANALVQDIALVAPSLLYLRGSFSSVQGAARTGLAALQLAQAVGPQVRVTPPSLLVRETGVGIFGLSGRGAGESYQWFRDDVLLPGVTGPELSLSNVTLLDAGRYTVQATNSAATASSSGMLSVLELDFAAWAAAMDLPTGQDGPLDDPDGDGATNQAEYLTRTNPLEIQSRFTVSGRTEAGVYRLSWLSVPQRMYVVKSSSDLLNWANAGQFPGDGTTQQFEQAVTPAHPRKFFRLEVSR